MKNYIFIFPIIVVAAVISMSVLFANTDVYAQTAQANQTIAITTTIDPVTILTNELMPLLDTNVIGNLTSLTITANLPCDTSNSPKIKIIAGILGNTTNVIDSSSDYTSNKGPRDTCIFTDKITNVTAKGIPAMNRVFLKNTESTPVHMPEGVMVTLTGIFGKTIKTTTPPSCPADFCDNFTSYSSQNDADAAYPTSDSAKVRVSISNDNIGFTNTRDNTNDQIVHDFGPSFVSNTQWQLRFKISATTWTTNGDSVFWVGLSDSNQTLGSTGAQDAIGIEFRNNAGERRVGATWKDGGTSHLMDSNNVNSAFNWSTNTDYFIKLSYASNTVTASIYDDSNYSNLLASASSGSITATDMRYFKISNAQLSGTSGSEFIGAIDDLKLWKSTSP